MPTCDLCDRDVSRRDLVRRLAIPEYRAMTGVWPWHEIAVCPACVEVHDRDFLERVRLLAPQVLEHDEPIAADVCLACGTVSSPEGWTQAGTWVDSDGAPTRAPRFRLCAAHAEAVYIDGVVVASNLAGRVGEVLAELPTAGADLLERVEGWRPGQGAPAGATDVAADRADEEVRADVLAFWTARPEGLAARGAWLGPVRRDYRMRYRLDVVRDRADGTRETLVVVRTGPETFTTYRTARARQGRGVRAAARPGGVRPCDGRW